VKGKKELHSGRAARKSVIQWYFKFKLMFFLNPDYAIEIVMKLKNTTAKQITEHQLKIKS